MTENQTTVLFIKTTEKKGQQSEEGTNTIQDSKEPHEGEPGDDRIERWQRKLS